MKIAYVTTYDASDIRHWSGLGYYISQSLAGAGLELDYIGTLKREVPLLYKLKSRLYRGYLPDREPILINSYARQVAHALNSSDADIVFSPGTIPIAQLAIAKPIVFWTDATFAGMVDFYPEFTGLRKKTITHGNKMEQAALSRCSYAIYASDWAAETACENYKVDSLKVKIVPFGANVACNRTTGDTQALVDCRDIRTIRLLFCGVDWRRKGGDVAVKTAQMLVSEGFDVELDVVGCEPIGAVPSFVRIHGFVSKKTTEGQRLFADLFSRAHFLLVPSQAECYGLVFAEASSFGLPSLAANVGGVRTVVKDDVNGRLFSLEDDAGEYCAYIKGILAAEGRYRKLAISSFVEYEKRLNWSVAGGAVLDLLRALDE